MKPKDFIWWIFRWNNGLKKPYQMTEQEQHQSFTMCEDHQFKKRFRKVITFSVMFSVISLGGAMLISWGKSVERDNQAEKGINDLRIQKVDRSEFELRLQNVKTEIQGDLAEIKGNQSLMMQFFGIKKEEKKSK